MQGTWRIGWSIAWRTVVIGLVLGVAFAVVLPPSPVDEIVLSRSRDDLAPYLQTPYLELSYVQAYQTVLRHTQSAVHEEGVLSYAYLYELLRGLIPVTLASVLAAAMVLKKQYRRFAIRVSDPQGARRGTAWPAVAFTGIVYAPFFALSVIYYAVPFSAVLTSWIVIYLGYLALCVVAWFAMIRLALNWPYRAFRITIIPTQASEVTV